MFILNFPFPSMVLQDLGQNFSRALDAMLQSEAAIDEKASCTTVLSFPFPSIHL